MLCGVNEIVSIRLTYGRFLYKKSGLDYGWFRGMRWWLGLVRLGLTVSVEYAIMLVAKRLFEKADC